jgi:hypothetical protein
MGRNSLRGVVDLALDKADDLFNDDGGGLAELIAASTFLCRASWKRASACSVNRCDPAYCSSSRFRPSAIFSLSRSFFVPAKKLLPTVTQRGHALLRPALSDDRGEHPSSLDA